MAALAATHPTLLDLAKRTDPDGAIADIVEILNETNEILDDMVWVEGNLATGHRTTVRTGIPAPTWRKMYGGVQPTKSTTAQITDNCGMLEAFGEVDVALADLNGNTMSFRASEDRAHLEGMSQEMADTLFYGNEGTEPEAFTGLAPRFNDTTAENGQNIIKAGGAGTDNSSIWLVVWDPNTCHGIVPKGSVAGVQTEDLGKELCDAPDSNGKYMAYVTHYRWDSGLTVRDWRYIVRIPNIDKSLLTKDASGGADLIDLMTQAVERVQGIKGRPAFYMPRNIRSYLRRQMVYFVKQASLSMDEVAGKKVMAFDGIPVRRCDALTADEALVS